MWRYSLASWRGELSRYIVRAATWRRLILSKVLSRYLAFRHADHPEALRDRTVLELGSGTGLCGIVAGILEPSANVWVTDQE